MKWVLTQLVEHKPDLMLDVIAFYVVYTQPSTCSVTLQVASQFKEVKIIEKALFRLLKTHNHGEVVSEALKVLLSVNNPIIDTRLKHVTNKRYKDRSFDRQGACMRLLEQKPREYP